MAFRFRQIVIAAGIGTLLFYNSCEKHPLGEIPEVQKEQVDPAKARSKRSAMESEKSTSSPTPAEFFPTNTPRKLN
jgi:hypothetical protein